MTIPTARAVAADLVLQINSGRISTQDLFGNPRLSELETKDRALAYEIVLGTLRWQLALDWLIEASSGRTVGNISASLIAILRISIFQLRFLTRVPEYAVVNEAVDLARPAGAKSAGFVNAVLRGYLRRKPALPAGDKVADQAIRTSHPNWLLQRWRKRFGIKAAEQIALKNNQSVRAAVRWNSRRGPVPDSITGKDAFRPCRTLQDCFYVDAIPSDFKEGEDYVYQDEASQMAAFIPPADSVSNGALDLCAAPGGKAFIMAQRFPEVFTILADLSLARLLATRDRVRGLGIETTRYIACDASAPLPFRRGFDLVFVDAPCSGLGTIRRNPEIKWRITEASLKSNRRRQAEILERAAHLVLPGGHLVYTTCSTEPEENSEVIASFLEKNRSLQLHPIQSPELLPFVDEGIYSTMSSYPDMDGFFGFLMRRSDSITKAPRGFRVGGLRVGVLPN